MLIATLFSFLKDFEPSHFQASGSQCISDLIMKFYSNTDVQALLQIYLFSLLNSLGILYTYHIKGLSCYISRFFSSIKSNFINQTQHSLASQKVDFIAELRDICLKFFLGEWVYYLCFACHQPNTHISLSVVLFLHYISYKLSSVLPHLKFFSNKITTALSFINSLCFTLMPAEVSLSSSKPEFVSSTKKENFRALWKEVLQNIDLSKNQVLDRSI